MTPQSQLEAVEVTRPIIGIENRTAQEVFDIMADRFRHRLAHSPAASDGLREAIARIKVVADVRRDFVQKRDAMNAAIPKIDATPAERALYAERYRADHKAERALWGAAIEFAVDADDIIALLPAGVEGEAEGLRAQIAHLESRLAAVDVLVGDGFWNSVHEAFDRAGAPRKSDDGGIVYGIIDRINQLAALNAPDRARGRLEGLEEAAKVADAAERRFAEIWDQTHALREMIRLHLRPGSENLHAEYEAANELHYLVCGRTNSVAAIRALSVPVRGEG